MKPLALLVVAIAVMGCKTQPAYTLLPWECTSATPPIDAEVRGMVNGRYIYDCNTNGDNDGSSSGNAGAEGNE